MFTATEKHIFKTDQYLHNRGGKPHFLNIYCDHCGQHLLLYQKDNPGKLKRLYLDRILAPEVSANLSSRAVTEIPDLKCHSCDRLIAVAGEYDKEPRKVYLLLSFATINKVTKGIYPPTVQKLDVSKKRK